MRFLDEKRAKPSSRKRNIQTAFLANYRRFMDIDVGEFPRPVNAVDEATSEPYAKDIADIRISLYSKSII